jgi:PAS domain S-box-containing protein
MENKTSFRQLIQLHKFEFLDDLETIYDNVPIGVCVIDSRCRYLYVNHRFAEINGIAASEHIGKTFGQIVPDLAEQGEALVRKILDSGKPVYDVEIKGQTSASPGTERVWKENWYPLKDIPGKVERIIIVAEDITGQKQTEEMLVLQSMILSQIKESVIAVDNDYRITYMNSEAEKKYRCTLEDTRGEKLSEIYQYQWLKPEDEKNAFLSLEKNGFWVGENIHIVKGGRAFAVESTVNIVKDSKGEKIGIVAAIEDLSLRKNLENVIDREEIKVQNILDSMADGVYVVNKDYDIEYINLALKKEFGELANQKCYQYLHDLERPCPACNNHEIMKEEKTLRWEWESDKNGKVYDLIDTPYYHLDGTISKLEIFRDITDKKKIERLKRKHIHQRIERLEKKKIAKELYDTVSQILYSSNLLSESLQRSWEKDPIKVTDNLKKIRDLNSEALKQMSILLYELSPPDIRKKSLVELLRGISQMLSENSNIEVDTDFKGKGKYSYKTRLEIYRIAQEAVSNIIKHSRASKIKIVFKQSPGDLSLVISDNGNGFNKNDKSFRKNFGLNIMKDRARSIGASFSVESSPGKGTSLFLFLSKKTSK